MKDKIRKVLKWTGGIIVALIIIGAIFGDTDETAETDSKELISYSILREWDPNDNPSSVGMEILVDLEDVSKESIVDLMEDFNDASDEVAVRVFQDIKAYEAEQNETYGEVYSAGYLAFYMKNKGINEVNWLQETGKLEGLFGSETSIK